MNQSFIALNETAILTHISHKNLILTIQPSVDSTNTYIKQLPITDKTIVCLAEQQTQGRGRMQRLWHSPLGENIYFSLRMPFQGELKQLSGFSLMVGLAVIDALHAVSKLNSIQIKWPNDLLYEKKKLAGVLVELDTLANQYFLTIGIGINVNMVEGNINQQWISLKKITGTTYDRNLLIAALIQQLEIYIPQFLQHGLSPYLAKYQQHDSLLNQKLAIQQGPAVYEGIAKSINVDGLLILQQTDGTNQLFAAGEAMILKN